MPTIRELRERRNWSRRELGDRLGISGQSVYYWEMGRSYPSTPLLRRVAEAFGVTMDEIDLVARNPAKRRSMRATDRGATPGGTPRETEEERRDGAGLDREA